MQDKAVLENNDSKINLLLALPSCPPVLNHEEGLEMEQQVIQIKSRIEALLTPTSPVNQKLKHGEDVVVKSLVKELEKTQKENDEDLSRVDALIDENTWDYQVCSLRVLLIFYRISYVHLSKCET